MFMDYLTEKQVSQELGIAVRTLQKWRLEGRGPAYMKLGKSVRYSRERLLRYLEERQIEPAPKPKPVATDYESLAKEGSDRVKLSGSRRGIYAEIARDWNARGLRTQTGLTWTKDTARRLIAAYEARHEK
jgi:excisionase family DNA binding protein